MSGYIDRQKEKTMTLMPLWVRAAIATGVIAAPVVALRLLVIAIWGV